MDTLVQIDQPAPGFLLTNLHGSPHTLEDLRGQVAILNFWSAECPWVEQADQELLSYLPLWGDAVIYWPVASNVNEPANLLLRVANERGLPVVLHDANHIVADQYGAQATPHFFVIDPQGIVRYQGALNDITFRQREPTRFYLRQAVDALLQGKHPDPAHTNPYGCALVREAA